MNFVFYIFFIIIHNIIHFPILISYYIMNFVKIILSHRILSSFVCCILCFGILSIMGGNTIKKISLGSGLFISFLLMIYSVIERKKSTDHINYLLFGCIGLVSLILYLIYFIKSFSEKMKNITKEEEENKKNNIESFRLIK